LQALHDETMRAYALTIVSRPGELSGVWRIPDANPNAQNFYLIVEAIAEDGSVLPLPIRSEEDQHGADRLAVWRARVRVGVCAGAR
jgi:hypothetical protein